MTPHARYTAEVVTVAAERLAEALKNALQCDSLPGDAYYYGRGMEAIIARFWRQWTRGINTNHFGRVPDAPARGEESTGVAFYGAPKAGVVSSTRNDD